jgi:hypothetical protein
MIKNNTETADWAWTTLIRSLQNDIAHLRTVVDDARSETAAARDQHRREIDGLILQLRDLRNEIAPVLEDREAARKAKREMVWGWVGRGGWLALAVLAAAVWHWVTNHLGKE